MRRFKVLLAEDPVFTGLVWVLLAALLLTVVAVVGQVVS